MPQNSGGGNSRRSAPATTPEGREAQLVSLAFDLAEKRLRAGTATSQEVTHFLKLGSTREQLEQQRMMYENMLTEAKIEALQSQAKMEDLYRKALNAMSAYQGREPVEPEDDYED
jgi:microsomal dipeptidase-like Zn-dependent dipeptidase